MLGTTRVSVRICPRWLKWTYHWMSSPFASVYQSKEMMKKCDEVCVFTDIHKKDGIISDEAWINDSVDDRNVSIPSSLPSALSRWSLQTTWKRSVYTLYLIKKRPCMFPKSLLRLAAPQHLLNEYEHYFRFMNTIYDLSLYMYTCIFHHFFQAL